MERMGLPGPGYKEAATQKAPKMESAAADYQDDNAMLCQAADQCWSDMFGDAEGGCPGGCPCLRATPTAEWNPWGAAVPPPGGTVPPDGDMAMVAADTGDPL